MLLQSAANQIYMAAISLRIYYFFIIKIQTRRGLGLQLSNILVIDHSIEKFIE